jgi:hypothetical protein
MATTCVFMDCEVSLLLLLMMYISFLSLVIISLDGHNVFKEAARKDAEEKRARALQEVS